MPLPVQKLSLLLLLWAYASLCAAHDTPIAILNIDETTVGTYKITWTFSSPRNLSPPAVIFPPHCERSKTTLDCGEKGLVGELKMLQLGERYSAAVVQISRYDSDEQVNYSAGYSFPAKKVSSFTLTGANPSRLLTDGGHTSFWEIGKSYLPLGFEHILLGIDHLLFVLGLILLVNRRWVMVKTITAFTVAHSLTLAAVTFGWLTVSEKSVNAAIALSIVYLAVELHKSLSRDKPFLSARLPVTIAFGFGLLHGFGFAGALTKIGLSAESIPPALLFFNIGVELGQLLFVAIVLALIWSNKTLAVQLGRLPRIATIYGMGSIASYWFISRLSFLLAPLYQ